MDDFYLESGPCFEADLDDEGPEFIVTKPATGWTEGDTKILERALDLAGIVEPAGRVAAAMSVDMLGIICLAPLVKSVESGLGQIREYFARVKGGIGK